MFVFGVLELMGFFRYSLFSDDFRVFEYKEIKNIKNIKNYEKIQVKLLI